MNVTKRILASAVYACVLIGCSSGGTPEMTSSNPSSSSANNGSGNNSNDDNNNNNNNNNNNGSNSNNGTANNSEISPAYCLPDLSAYDESAEQPKIELIGPRVLLLDQDEPYVDAGALASDEQDGDLSADISVYGLSTFNTRNIGDTLIRYEVTDSNGNAARPVYRIIRVMSNQPTKVSKRFFDDIDAPWEYVEHLPSHFGIDPEQTYPLIIANHGWSHSKRFDGSGTMERMDYLSMVTTLQGDSWNDERPFIILTPQRCWSDFGGRQVDILHSFVEWAKRNYPIDPNRVYMTGLSMGGWATWEYARSYPETLAAANPIAGGGDWTKICGATDVPIWAFAARDDNVVPYIHVTGTIDALRQCQGSIADNKITVFPTGGHVIDDEIYDLSNLNLGTSDYDIYDQDIFEWFLTYSKDPLPVTQ